MRASRRPLGVRISAFLLIIAGVAGLLCCGLLLFLELSPNPSISPSTSPILGFAAVAFVGSATWAITSGIGVFRLREWARVSALVLGALVALFSCVLLIETSIQPLPPDPGVAQVNPAAIRLIMVAIFGIPAAVSIWLLFYLTRARVSDRFDTARTGAWPLEQRGPVPTSVLIVGWFLIISTAYEAWVFLMPVPVFLFSVLLVGRSAHLLFFTYAFFHVVLGIGLLKLKNWARIGTIAYFALRVANSLISIFTPGSSARFQAAMSGFHRAFGPSPHPVHTHLWFGLLFSVPIAVAVTWVLVTQKGVFLQSSAQPPIAPLETSP